MMTEINRRTLLKTASASAVALTAGPLSGFAKPVAAAKPPSADSLPMQLYKSLNDEQKEKVCLPVNHARRQFVSNWWYIHRDHRIPNTFSAEQQELIQRIFDSLHHPEFKDKVNKQVEIDQYGQEKNAPAVGFFGTPNDDDFEFLYTGHHVTRRCNAHSNKGQGFGGAPIFYGHFLEDFYETKDHLGNPYWYQGKIFNEFVQGLSEKQQAAGLTSSNPRSEKADSVIRKRENNWPGLKCKNLADDQKTLLADTMRKMLKMFREDDVAATLRTIQQNGVIDRLYVSWFDGKYDIGSDKVWDTWQIEGPDMVWYFRGEPHIHSYFHLKT